MMDTIWMWGDTYLRGANGAWRVVDFAARTRRPATPQETLEANRTISRFEVITGHEIPDQMPVVLLPKGPLIQMDLFAPQDGFKGNPGGMMPGAIQMASGGPDIARKRT